MRVKQEICLGHFKDTGLLRIEQIGVETNLNLVTMFETRESITQMMDTEVTPRARKVYPYVTCMKSLLGDKGTFAYAQVTLRIEELPVQRKIPGIRRSPGSVRGGGLEPPPSNTRTSTSS